MYTRSDFEVNYFFSLFRQTIQGAIDTNEIHITIMFA